MDEKLLSSSPFMTDFLLIFNDFLERLDGFYIRPFARNLKNAGMTLIHNCRQIKQM